MTSDPKEELGPDKLTTDQALEIFSSEEAPMPQRRRALSVLVGNKYLPKNAEEALIEKGLWNLVIRARGDTSLSDSDRLMALAECIRFAQVVKKQASAVSDFLQPIFGEEPLPPLALLAEADDRLNVARAFASAPNAPWITKWLARAIADEETGEKARAELLLGLVKRSDSLAAALSQIVRAYETCKPLTDSPGDTLGRRLTRTLSAWRDVLRDSELPVGNGLGTALYELLALPLSEHGRPQQEKVQLELCEEALLTVHDSVRTRISLAADPDIYKVTAYCRRLFGGRDWPTALRSPLQRLIADVSETILLLGRQGQRDQTLLEQLQVLCNTGEQARTVARRLAQEHTELPEPVRDWLNLGHIRAINQASAEIREAAQGSADGSIGLALAESRQLRARRDILEQPLLTTLDLYEPTLLSATEDLIAGVQALTVFVEQVAQLRGVTLLGVPGEELEVDAKFFDIAGSHPRLRMQVKKPAVVKLRVDGSLGDVLVRGIVA